MGRSIAGWATGVCFVLASQSVLAGTGKPEIGRYVRAYEGDEGIVVWIMRYGAPAAQTALVQVNGIDHELDHRILKTKIVPQQVGSKYFYEAGGKQYELLRVRESGYELQVPGSPRVSPLRYDKELSKAGRPDQFLVEFQEQK